ncbi:hypothetical protein ABH926_007395 [Catenulispora sp. GP43]|uniref:hypothetical protein n=1 Tax=Catenulispora sp. GP43 TaxID=3156263 RepID=UPI0035145E02
MTRITFIPFVGIIGICTLALAGCGDSTGTTNGTGSGAPSALGVPPTANGAQSSGAQGNETQGNETQSTSAGAGTGAGSSGGTSNAPTLALGGWTLSAPNSVFGFAQIQPQASNLTKIRSELAASSAQLGVAGRTPVIAVYDDPTHDVYVIFAGYNGSGFDPAKLTAKFGKMPSTSDDGAGDRMTTNNVQTDPGPHGGTAGCSSVLDQSGALAAESTACEWMTSTTMGSVSYYPKGDNQKMVFGTGPEVMGKVMRDLRNLVEHNS